VAQRCDDRWFGEVLINFSDAGQGMKSVAVHGTRPANTLSARSSEGESRIKVVLDIDERIKIHGRHFF
jgi:hypothetical protein